MIKRINQYLLTHYPLVWNTRLVWMLMANFILHLLFFTGGFLAISASKVSEYYRLDNVGGVNMYILSVLCGLVILVTWFIFFLRNNAFKNFYRIGKWYLAKEFVFIFIILLTSANYFMSYNWGVRTRVRSFTNKEQLIHEIDVVNMAATYIPTSSEPYFLLNNCDERGERKEDNIYTDITTFDTTFNYSDKALAATDSSTIKMLQDDQRLKEAMRRRDAFSYINYCSKQINSYDDSTTASSRYLSATNKRWLLGGRKDSVRIALEAFYKVLDKYHYDYRLRTDSIINRVFADPQFVLGKTIETDEFSNINGYQVPNTLYLNKYRLNDIFELLEDSQLTKRNLGERLLEWTITLYSVLSLSIFILCYRRFSKRVFLISTIGTIIWAILIGLMVAGSHSEGSFLTVILILAIAFALIGVLSLNGSSKTLAGVCLNWHAYLVPFIVMLVVGLITSYYQHASDDILLRIDEWDYMKKNYPISSWVKEHTKAIFQANFFVSFAYVACLFNKWAKRWQAMPEE